MGFAWYQLNLSGVQLAFAFVSFSICAYTFVDNYL